MNCHTVAFKVRYAVSMDDIKTIFTGWLTLTDGMNRERLHKVTQDAMVEAGVWLYNKGGADKNLFLNKDSVDLIKNEVYNYAALLLSKKRLEDKRTQGLRNAVHNTLEETGAPVDMNASPKIEPSALVNYADRLINTSKAQINRICADAMPGHEQLALLVTQTLCANIESALGAGQSASASL